LVLWHDSGVSWAQTQSEILQREADAGRTLASGHPFDGLGLHYGGGGPFQGFSNCAYITPSQAQEQWVHDQGSIPVVSWSPNDSLAQINAGNADGCIKAVADYELGFNFTVMLRILWEFQSNFLWVGCRQPYVDAYQRFVNLFKSEAMRLGRPMNVGFIWSPQEPIINCPGGSTREASYPGDSYVDWIGSDRYNSNGCDNGACYSTPCHGGWAEWWELFNYTGNCTSTAGPDVYTAWSSHKPFIPMETGSKYDLNDPNHKANWFRNIYLDPRGIESMQYAIGIEFFDQFATAGSDDWFVDHNQPAGTNVEGTVDPVTYQGFKDLAASSMFNP
jgi:hypothetical protein